MQISLNKENLIKSAYSLSEAQELKLQNLIDELKIWNLHTNLVGKSTLINPWNSHILDSIQISNLIKNKNSSILDMGTGAGFPGLVLAIMDYKKVNLIDSNGKKIRFIKHVCSKYKIKANIFLGRIEKMKKNKYDFLISRALAKLNQLFVYSQNFINNDSVLIFLKGKNINSEIIEAKKQWSFKFKLIKSKSDDRGRVLLVENLSLKK
tara:strand:+ start:2534 stop:3157 length:624 start_codon:yes stop_codon:yes gene_type:complete